MTGKTLKDLRLVRNKTAKRLLVAAANVDVVRAKRLVKEAMTCPLGGGIFREPVVWVGDGETYERAELVRYIGMFGTEKRGGVGRVLGAVRGLAGIKSPVTGDRVRCVDWVMNYAVKSMVDNARREAGEGRGGGGGVGTSVEEVDVDLGVGVGFGEGGVGGKRERERTRTNSFDEMWSAVGGWGRAFGR
jgi:hypothetical protein